MIESSHPEPRLRFERRLTYMYADERYVYHL